jgi:transketolase
VSTAISPAQVANEGQRERFYRLAPELLVADRRLALVLADIGVDYLDPESVAPVADRVINVGIREQLLIGVAGGLGLAGIRPIVHTFVPFLLERPYEQVKLDLDHQGVGAVLVSAGASYSWPVGGETHFGPRDVALLDTLDGWTVHVPGHPDEAELLLRQAVAAEGRVYLRLDPESNSMSRPDPAGRLQVVRTGRRGTVVAVGPTLDRVLAAAEGRDLTVAYAHTVRPFDAAGLRAVITEPDVVVVEPYLAGTSVRVLSDALRDLRHRVLGLGVGPHELRRYGTVAEHHAAHGLDVVGIRGSLDRFFAGGGSAGTPG